MFKSRIVSLLSVKQNIVFKKCFSQMKSIVLGVYTEKREAGNEVADYTASFKDVDSKCNGKLSSLLKATGPFGKSVKHKLFWVPTITESKLDFDCVSVVDLGSKEAKPNPLEGVDDVAERIRCAIAGGVQVLQSSSDFEEISVDPCANAKCASEGASLIQFKYECLKDPASCRPKSRIRLYEHSGLSRESSEAFQRGMLLGEAQNFARFLMESPANHMTPTIFADTVTQKLKESGVQVIVRDEDWIKSKHMTSFLSVARGSEEKPKFVEIHYKGAPGTDKCIAFVGKGITFDSGGISLKHFKGMDLMRADMGGAACVSASILAASLLKLKVNVKGFIPLCENMPSGKANKPGDVVRAMNGKTIQVDNTDNEGRLILADALCYAQEFKPLLVLDMATLTGEIMLALGGAATGAFSNDDDLWNTLNKAGSVTGDRVWRMPLFDYYKKQVKKCDLADIINITKSGFGGSCIAAAFLSEFIQPDTKWLHLDIASVMQNSNDVAYLSNGMSGRPTRTIVQFLKELEEKFQ